MAMRIVQMFLEPNWFSRRQQRLNRVEGLVVHWTANPGTSARQNRNYFNNLRFQKRGKKPEGGYYKYKAISAHYIVDELEVIQCLPTTEVAFHVRGKVAEIPNNIIPALSNNPNMTTIGIEMCCLKCDGSMDLRTVRRTQCLLFELCKHFDLDPCEDIYRHHDVNPSKDCPRWYVRNERDWEYFRLLVKELQIVDKMSPNNLTPCADL